MTRHYLSRSWALLTHDKGWVKPVLVLALVNLVPVIGPLAVLGYVLEWARLTAWGIDSSPKQKGVKVGEVLKSGWRGFVVLLVWELVAFAAFALLDGLVGITKVDWLIGLVEFLCVVADVVLTLIVTVAQVRAAVYQKISPGLRADRVLQMSLRDFGGLLRMLGITALFWLVGVGLGIAFVICLAIAWVPLLMGFGSGATLPGMHALVSAIQGILVPLGPILVVFLFLYAVLNVLCAMVVVTGVGLWMRQFDVPHWGKSSDPLPNGTHVEQVARD